MEELGSTGFADAMAKILRQKVPAGKSPILAKCPSLKKKASESEKREVSDSKKRKIQRQNIASLRRVSPQDSSVEYEKSLVRIATKGVVQLFNAVRKQQKTIEQNLAEAGPLESKKDKVLSSLSKGEFLDMLKSPISNQKNSLAKDSSNEAENKVTESGSKWTVLDDDLMYSMTKMNQYEKNDSSDEKDVWSSDSDEECNQ